MVTGERRGAPTQNSSHSVHACLSVRRSDSRRGHWQRISSSCRLFTEVQHPCTVLCPQEAHDTVKTRSPSILRRAGDLQAQPSRRSLFHFRVDHDYTMTDSDRATAVSPSLATSYPSPPQSPVLEPSRLGPYSPHAGPDLEAYPPLSATATIASERDPLLLRTRIRSDEDVFQLRRRGSRKHKSARRPRLSGETELTNSKAVAGFYENQNAHINALLKPIEVHAHEAGEAEAADALKIKIAIYGSLVCNCVLAILQIYAAVRPSGPSARLIALAHGHA